MKKEIADKWVTALRSGKYKQTKGGLRNGNGFCCLGVLCDISGLGRWTGIGRNGIDSYTTSNGTGVATLPKDVMDWAGMVSGAGCYLDNQACLVYHNDFDNFTFNDIADIIEQVRDEL